jgi:hypothetical protein
MYIPAPLLTLPVLEEYRVLSLVGLTVTDWAEVDGAGVAGIGVGGAGVGRVAFSSVTVIVAVMEGCTVQKYGNSPASWTVKAKVWPLFSMPLSQMPSLLGETPDVDV